MLNRVSSEKKVTFISLSSGSDGNCYYIGDERTSILIDVGIGVRTIRKRLAEFGKKIDEIKLVLVTHDHIDHIRHLGSIAEHYKVPIYSSPMIHNSLAFHPCTAGKMASCRKILEKGVPLTLLGITITAFEVPHDGTDNVGYYIDFKGEKIVLITDVGEINDEIINYCKMANHLILESNYDNDMLINGSYPQILIERIKNGRGHLSNAQTAAALKKIWHPNLKNLFLCHLSSNNNTPEIAYRASNDALHELGLSVGRDINLFCLPRRESFLYQIKD